VIQKKKRSVFQVNQLEDLLWNVLGRLSSPKEVFPAPGGGEDPERGDRGPLFQLQLDFRVDSRVLQLVPEGPRLQEGHNTVEVASLDGEIEGGATPEIPWRDLAPGMKEEQQAVNVGLMGGEVEGRLAERGPGVQPGKERLPGAIPGALNHLIDQPKPAPGHGCVERGEVMGPGLEGIRPGGEEGVHHQGGALDNGGVKGPIAIRGGEGGVGAVGQEEGGAGGEVSLDGDGEDGVASVVNRVWIRATPEEQGPEGGQGFRVTGLLAAPHEKGVCPARPPKEAQKGSTENAEQ